MAGNRRRKKHQQRQRQTEGRDQLALDLRRRTGSRVKIVGRTLLSARLVRQICLPDLIGGAGDSPAPFLLQQSHVQRDRYLETEDSSLLEQRQRSRMGPACAASARG